MPVLWRFWLLLSDTDENGAAICIEKRCDGLEDRVNDLALGLLAPVVASNPRLSLNSTLAPSPLAPAIRSCDQRGRSHQPEGYTTTVSSIPSFGRGLWKTLRAELPPMTPIDLGPDH
jgi:hypothetical protein